MPTTTRKKKQPLGYSVANRQKQLMRLMQRYATMIYDAGALVQRYSWNIGYINLDTKEVLHFEDYGCYSNNIAFVAMIFESDNLPSKISIFSIEFNELLQ